MAKRIRAIRHAQEINYGDDGTIQRVTHRVSYLKEDTADPELSAWVTVETPDIDGARTVDDQLKALEDAAKTAEGIVKPAPTRE